VETEYDIKKFSESNWSRSWICRSRSGVGVRNKRLRSSLAATCYYQSNLSKERQYTTKQHFWRSEEMDLILLLNRTKRLEKLIFTTSLFSGPQLRGGSGDESPPGSNFDPPLEVFWIVIYFIIFSIFSPKRSFAPPPKIFLFYHGMFSSCDEACTTFLNVWIKR